MENKETDTETAKHHYRQHSVQILSLLLNPEEGKLQPGSHKLFNLARQVKKSYFNNPNYCFFPHVFLVSPHYRNIDVCLGAENDLHSCNVGRFVVFLMFTSVF